ncbi:hypothetical protein CAter10_4334 [Collimonas arenae]|nr:hypothetical protein CAter10_4334 [Collimonas arenae]
MLELISLLERWSNLPRGLPGGSWAPFCNGEDFAIIDILA